ncbi:hypothetical protein [Actinoplanes sp. NPDC049316]|uniref:hypothetical protein n=1 Tax=Actinoplanes sp. NPDC049316 TaxID=3154727 RepID=UPI003415197F
MSSALALLLGSTPFLGLRQPAVRDAALNCRLTGMGLAWCLFAGAMAVAVVILL